MANQSSTAFCTKCGAPRGGGKFCTSCGASFEGGPAAQQDAGDSAQHVAAPAASQLPLQAIVIFLVLVAAGSTAFYVANQRDNKPTRAVAGSPGMPPGAQGGEGGTPALPEGHPSIELPKEVTDFLAQLTADADKDPKSVDAWQRLARARYRAGTINPSYLPSAQQALDKLLELDPANQEGLRISANIAYDTGDYPEAQKRFETYLAKVPDDPSAITDLGSVLLFQDRTDDAMAKYRLALEKDPKFLQAHFNLAIALQKAGKKDEALAELQRARALAEDPEQQKSIDEAIADMQGTPRPDQAEAGGAAPGGGGMGGPGMGGGGAVPGSGAAQGMPSGMPGTGVATVPPGPKPSNASTEAQRDADKLIGDHPIIGSHVQSFQWVGDGDCRVQLVGFPMSQMPPFALEKFKATMNVALTKLAADKGLAKGIHLDLVDAADGTVMGSLGEQR